MVSRYEFVDIVTIWLKSWTKAYKHTLISRNKFMKSSNLNHLWDIPIVSRKSAGVWEVDKISPEYLTPITVWYGKQGVSALGNANLMDNNIFGAKSIYSSGLGRKSFMGSFWPIIQLVINSRARDCYAWKIWILMFWITCLNFSFEKALSHDSIGG